MPVFNRLISRLDKLLSENLEKCPLTDLYLTHPILKSQYCTKQFRQKLLGFIESQSEKQICSLVNSAVCTVSTYILAGGYKNAQWIRQTIGWIKRQRLNDGGWHWKPKRKLPTKAESEAWITAAVISLLKVTGGASTKYLDSILLFLEKDWTKRKWNGFPEVTLFYLSEGGFKKDDPLIRKAILWLKKEQLPNGAWPGYSRKTKKGGIFRTCVVLNALTAAGLKRNDKAVMGGLEFIEPKLDRILNAEWGEILVQALYSLVNALLNLNSDIS
jgi:squalene cyclase